MQFELLILAGKDQREVYVEAMVEDAMVGGQLVVLAVVTLGVGFLVLRVPLGHELNAL